MIDENYTWTAMPTLARFSAAASPTPSPTMPQRYPTCDFGIKKVLRELAGTRAHTQQVTYEVLKMDLLKGLDNDVLVLWENLHIDARTGE